MTPEEEREHNKFMDKVNEFVERLKGKYKEPEPEPEYVYDEPEYVEHSTLAPHLDSVPVSLPAVKADTKRVPATLREMVEGK